MNWCYWLTLGFGFLATFFMIQGGIIHSRQSAEKQNGQIIQELRGLGERIDGIKSIPNVNAQKSEIKKVERAYDDLAKRFFAALPEKIRQEESKSAQKRALQLKQSRDIEQHLKILEEEAQKIATAYNNANQKINIKIEKSEFPLDIFNAPQEKPYYVLLSFSGKSYWAIRFVWYPDRTPAVEFVRLIDSTGTRKFRDMQLTEDSIQLVLFEKEYGISLNQSISDGVRYQVIKDIDVRKRNMDDFDATAKLLLQRIIEYELLKQAP